MLTVDTPRPQVYVDTPRPQVYEAGALASSLTSYFGLMRNRIIARDLAQALKVVELECA